MASSQKKSIFYFLYRQKKERLLEFYALANINVSNGSISDVFDI